MDLQGLIRPALSLLLGFVLGLALLNLPYPRDNEGPAITMASVPSTMTRSGSQFMQPVMARQSMQRASALMNEAEHSTKPVTMGRRDLAGAAAGLALAGASAAHAEYGTYARMFGAAPTNPTGFAAYTGDEFSMLLPSKWNPSKEKDFPGILLRYEDNFDAVNNLAVMKLKSDKSKVSDYGPPEKFLNEFSYLLGKQSYSGKTISEGGFAPDRVSAASVLDVESTTDKKGRAVYKYNILARTADGDEGGRHQLISATVSGGNLWILKIQVGDKRWFKGVKKEAEGAFNSFLIKE